jgi:hypothetical protein
MISRALTQDLIKKRKLLRYSNDKDELEKIIIDQVKERGQWHVCFLDRKINLGLGFRFTKLIVQVPLGKPTTTELVRAEN